MIKFRAREACSLKLSGGNGSTGVRGELATSSEQRDPSGIFIIEDSIELIVLIFVELVIVE